MSKVKVVLLVLIVCFIMIQFFRPVNNLGHAGDSDISQIYSVPANIQEALKTSCYDCHSNQTVYPWYTSIQPIGWWVDAHIKKGKKELDFNEFGTYSKRRQFSKLKSINESIEDGTMPLSSYTFIHKKTNLSTTDKTLIMNLAQNTWDSLSLKH